MKRVAVMWGLLLVACTGCLKLDPTVTLDKDGSGRIDISYTISEQYIDQFRAMYKLREELEGVSGDKTLLTPREQYTRVFLDPSDVGLRRVLKPCEVNGVTINKLKIDTRSALRSVTAQIAFRSLADLAKCELFRLYGFNLTRDAAGNYELERPASRGELPSDKDLGDAEHVKTLMPILGGFHVSLKTVLPGRVLATNAPRRSSRSVVWVFDFNDDPRSFALVQTRSLRVQFAGAGLDLPTVSCEVGKPAAP